MAKPNEISDWQTAGGVMDIPDGWFVTRVKLDCDKPHIAIAQNGIHLPEKYIRVPKALAYYLRRHDCGSKEMRETIREGGKREVRKAIKVALGL